MSSTIKWILIFFGIVVAELLFWGMITDSGLIMQLGVINSAVFLMIGIPAFIDRAIQKGYLHDTLPKKLKKSFSQFLIRHGLAVLLGRISREVLHGIVLGEWHFAYLVVASFVLVVSLYITQNQLPEKGICREEQRMTFYHRGLVWSAMVSMLLLLKYRMYGSTHRYVLSVGIGWLAYTIFLAWKYRSRSRIFRHVGWGLFAGIFCAVVLWAGVSELFSWYDARTFEKVVYKERTVYVEKETPPEEEESLFDESLIAQRLEQVEKVSTEDVELLLGTGDVGSGQVDAGSNVATGILPVDEESRGENQENEDEEGRGYVDPVCGSTGCLLAGTDICYELPDNAECLPQDTDDAWKCIEGHTEFRGGCRALEDIPWAELFPEGAPDNTPQSESSLPTVTQGSSVKAEIIKRNAQ